jgi:hypothetical protein
MALKITDLRIDPKSLGQTMLLADITPSYEYKDGERTDKLEGYRYSVVLPAHKMEKLGVKVLNKTPLIDIESEEIPIGTPVQFANLEVGSYFSKTQGVSITAKADSVNFVTAK